MSEEKEKGLIVIDKLVPAQLFIKDGTKDILEKIKAEVAKFVPDMTTEKGRKEIKSFARKIASSRGCLDNLGKDLTKEWRDKIDIVNEERKKVVTTLDELRDKVKEPVTLWENKNKERIAKHQNELATIKALSIEAYDLTDCEINLLAVQQVTLGERWDEFIMEAHQVREDAINMLTIKVKSLKEQAAKDAELEQFRKEKEAREQKERDEKIAKEAAEKARVEAEQKAKLEAEQKEKERIALVEKAKKEKEQAAKREREQKERADKAEKEKIESEKRAAREKIESAKREAQAKIDAAKREEILKKKAAADKKIAAAEAAIRERELIEKEQNRLEVKARRREADKKHQAKINNEAADAIHRMFESQDEGYSNVLAKEIIVHIALGKVPHVKISY